jgi:hypothetical protein
MIDIMKLPVKVDVSMAIELPQQSTSQPDCKQLAGRIAGHKSAVVKERGKKDLKARRILFFAGALRRIQYSSHVTFKFTSLFSTQTQTR